MSLDPEGRSDLLRGAEAAAVPMTGSAALTVTGQIVSVR
jgi:hypothetical protein